jgi:hypothetical protein
MMAQPSVIRYLLKEKDVWLKIRERAQDVHSSRG